MNRQVRILGVTLARMEPQGLLEHQRISEESPTETDFSWVWVNQESPLPHQMEPHGI